MSRWTDWELRTLPFWPGTFLAPGRACFLSRSSKFGADLSRPLADPHSAFRGPGQHTLAPRKPIWSPFSYPMSTLEMQLKTTSPYPKTEVKWSKARQKHPKKELSIGRKKKIFIRYHHSHNCYYWHTHHPESASQASNTQAPTQPSAAVDSWGSETTHSIEEEGRLHLSQGECFAAAPRELHSQVGTRGGGVM